MNNRVEVVIKVGFEGGSVTLWQRLAPEGTTEFAVGTNEAALADLLSEEDQDLVLALHRKPTAWVASFDEGMDLLDQYQWMCGYPSHVHQNYRERIWDFVLRGRPSRSSLSRWAAACDVDFDARLATLANWILDSRSTVVLSGAGLSVASGVPDFRSPSGWWNNVDPTTVATADALQNNYELFRSFYSHRIRALEELHPNIGHEVIARWEERGLVAGIVTQNVDGFHQMAGAKNVYELHGSIRSIRCVDCGKDNTTVNFLNGDRCNKCGGHLRPNVILFDEMLPAQAWDDAIKSIEKSDLVIVLGSSLSVYPANTLPSLTSGKTAVINSDATPAERDFDLVIHGKLEEILPEVDRWVELSQANGRH